MICKHCRAWIDDDSVFCESCGSRVVSDGNNDETQDLSNVLKEEIDNGIRDLNELMSFDKKTELKQPSRVNLDRTLVFHKPEREKSAHVAPKVVEKPIVQTDTERKVDVMDILAGAETEKLVETPEPVVDKKEPIEVKEEIPAEPVVSEKSQEVETPAVIEEPEVAIETEIEKEDEVSIQEPEIPVENEPEVLEEADAEEDQELEVEESVASMEVEPMEVEQETKPLFCMACGEPLPQGAAFCAICGTPTGEVAPKEIHRRRTKQSLALPLLKTYFPKPEDAIQQAATEDAVSIGASVFAVKALILAVIAAVFLKPLSGLLGESWFTAGDAFGFAAKVFLGVLIGDALMVALIFGAGKIFKQDVSIKALLGTCGIANILPSILWIITLILAATAPVVALAVSMIAIAVSTIFTSKSIDAVYNVKDGRSIYIISSVSVVYIAVIYLVITLLI